VGDTLTARVRRSSMWSVIGRVRPRADAAPLLKAWARNEVHAVIVTSSAGLRNLFEMVRQARPVVAAAHAGAGAASTHRCRRARAGLRSCGLKPRAGDEWT